MNIVNESAPKTYKPHQKMLAIFIVLIFVIGFLYAIDLVKAQWGGSKQINKLKNSMQEIASVLDKASSTGDKVAAITTFESISNIKYNLISADAANHETMRYCLIATMHLSDAADSIHQHGVWLNKSLFQNAISECK